jgi:hypothetical protein
MTCTAATPTPRTPKPQTLSVRISDAIRRRVERAKQLSASLTGTDVSTSVIAKQFLELAREDRLEVVRLLAHPNDALIQTRQKGHGQQLVSRAEWTCWRILCGMLHPQTQHPASRASLLAVLDAFLAVSDLRNDDACECHAGYVGNLPPDCRPTTATRAGRFHQGDVSVIRQTVTDTHRRVSDRTAGRTGMDTNASARMTN